MFGGENHNGNLVRDTGPKVMTHSCHRESSVYFGLQFLDMVDYPHLRIISKHSQKGSDQKRTGNAAEFDENTQYKLAGTKWPNEKWLYFSVFKQNQIKVIPSFISEGDKPYWGTNDRTSSV